MNCPKCGADKDCSALPGVAFECRTGPGPRPTNDLILYVNFADCRRRPSLKSPVTTVGIMILSPVAMLVVTRHVFWRRHLADGKARTDREDSSAIRRR
jgi:hypothetical protein